jgi:hypothetical protein
MSTPTLSLDDNELSDSPQHFAEAAEAFVDRYIRPLTAHHVANVLSWLARCGYIVSAAEHDRRCAEYAALLSHVEQAADELVRRLHERGQQ